MANVKTWAGDPRGWSKAETMMFVSRTTRIMRRAEGIPAAPSWLLRSPPRSHRRKADRDQLAWIVSRTSGAIPVPSHAPAPAGHTARSRGHAPALWRPEPWFARREDQWSKSWDHASINHI